MNSIDKNIFASYETVETALLNELATEAKTKGKKARTLKGEGYYVKYDGVQYDITAEQCRIHKLIRNNYNVFVEQLNSAKSDVLGVWKNVYGERLTTVISEMEKGLEICQMYFDAFKSFITGEEEETVEKSEEPESVVDEKNEETSENVVETETSENAVETETSENVVETETSVATYCQEQDAEDFVCKTHTHGQDRDSRQPQNGS